MRRYLTALSFSSLAGAAIVAVLVSCLSDPREDEAVIVTDKCDVAKLSALPTSPESSLRAYVDSTKLLLDKSTVTETALKDACNAINTDLQQPPGADVGGACKPVFQRIQTVIAKEPPSAPGALGNTSWVDIDFPSSCTIPAGTTEGCIAKCAGACDPSKCEPGKVAGKCAGDCVGTCSEVGENIACRGKCVGRTELDGGSCKGECVGRCTANAWVGECTGACPAAFNGTCAGTCTGQCDGIPVGDAGGGPIDAGGDDGEAGPVEAGPPNPFPKPPGGNDGNCKGKCIGVCSSGATGSCSGPCLTYAAGPPIGAWKSGFCGAGGTPAAACTGTCDVAGGNGTTSTCNGNCSQAGKPSCGGICRNADGGGCNGALSDSFCEGNLACGQNAECNNACQAFGILSSTCTDPTFSQIFTVTDPALAAALKKNQGALGKALNQLSLLRGAINFIGNRSLGDFRSLGLSGDLVTACVTEARANVEAANVKIDNASKANPTLRSTK